MTEPVFPESQCYVPIRAITQGPKYHWFAYYDKLQFDPSGRFALGMEVDFEGRSPRPDDVIKVGMIDLEDGDRWIELGESRAWCWQQGCMLQWLPGSDNEIIWNDRQGDRYVSHIMNVETGDTRTIPTPIYTISPDGRTAYSNDFRRVGDMRPGYGYNGIPDPNVNVLAPGDAGVWRVDLETGKTELIVSIGQVAALNYMEEDWSASKHWFNHLLVNTDGTRVEFLHRWLRAPHRWGTGMLTVNPDGSDLRIVNDTSRVSHFVWRDPRHLLAFAGSEDRQWAFFVLDEIAGGTELVIDDPHDGHCTYLPGNEWIVNDSYPGGADRMQNLYLFHVPTKRRVDLGQFHLPKEYLDEWRCDLHPRCDRQGNRLCIDSVHGGDGRQIYLLDISEIVNE
ncbi:hypothetical protein HQ520_07645 [bacterium]|nr:hypothetical protein [bacterium]